MPAIERMITESGDLAKRFLYGGYNYDNCPYGTFWNGSNCQYSSWLTWGRWVLTVVLIVVAFIIFAAASGIQARKRRRAGRQPMYGTAWMAPPSYDQSQNQYGGNNNSYQMSSNQEAYAPPAYPPPAGNAAGTRETQYQPPASPPPTKNKY